MSYGRKPFSWNPEGTCILGSITKPRSKCLFDYWTTFHFYFTGMMMILCMILLQYFDLLNDQTLIWLMLFLNIAHAIEEYLGNTTRLSLEGVVIDNIGPLFNPKMKPEKRQIDNDYLQNTIGDILSGIIATILIYFYYQTYNKIPVWYLWGFIFTFIMLVNKSKGFE
jgi:hypothetical protein